MPDFYASDAKVVSIDASNMAQYKDKLPIGVQQLMTKFPDFRIDVYPTHRPACGPQIVYDNTAKNFATAQAVPSGLRDGFTGAFGGYPFPILDTDPNIAGAQAILNHNCRWQGVWNTRTAANHCVEDGPPIIASGYENTYYYPYYEPTGSFATWGGWVFQYRSNFIAPPASLSEQIVYYSSMNPVTQPSEAWIYLAGQGRVRKAPELQYDNPQAASNGLNNIDDNQVFVGAIDKYDWKLLGKQEMYVPYNCNKLTNATIAQAMLPKFFNPDYVRWELHRVWVVEATLHPGERHVVPKRRFYFDEDTWNCLITDNWDAGGNFWKVVMGCIENRPDVPAHFTTNVVVYDLQRNNYSTEDCIWNDSPWNSPYDMSPKPMQNFNPQTMAAQNQY
jgi:hypothetical protein